MVSWYPWTYEYGRHGGNKSPLEKYALRKLYDGTYDNVIRREAEQLARFEYPVILRFAPEMNGFWYPWAEAPTGNIRGEHRNSNQLGDFVKLDAAPNGGIAFDSKFFVDWPKGHRPHQVRLQGGDCSSDSYCYP